jgi:hypothetical protein
MINHPVVNVWPIGLIAGFILLKEVNGDFVSQILIGRILIIKNETSFHP